MDVSATRYPTVLQVLPALESGGVERGTLEIAAAIETAGGRALVASAGGRMLGGLARTGAGHFTLSLASRDPPCGSMRVCFVPMRRHWKS